MTHSHSTSETARILLVEDDELNRMLGEILLQNAGYQVDTAVNGLEALAALEKGGYDLVLMDCIMPELDGYDATRQYRAREADLNRARLPIIAFTANSKSEYASRCQEAGMDDFIPKPLTPDILLGKVQQWLPR